MRDHCHRLYPPKSTLYVSHKFFNEPKFLVFNKQKFFNDPSRSQRIPVIGLHDYPEIWQLPFPLEPFIFVISTEVFTALLIEFALVIDWFI